MVAEGKIDKAVATSHQEETQNTYTRSKEK